MRSDLTEDPRRGGYSVSAPPHVEGLLVPIATQLLGLARTPITTVAPALPDERPHRHRRKADRTTVLCGINGIRRAATGSDAVLVRSSEVQTSPATRWSCDSLHSAVLSSTRR